MPIFWRGRTWERLVPVPKGQHQPCPRCHGAIMATGDVSCPAECIQCGEQFYELNSGAGALSLRREGVRTR